MGGKTFLHIQDDSKDYFAARRPDWTYLIASETTLTARSEPYNRKGVHVTNLTHGADALGTVITASDVTARNHGSQR